VKSLRFLRTASELVVVLAFLIAFERQSFARTPLFSIVAEPDAEGANAWSAADPGSLPTPLSTPWVSSVLRSIRMSGLADPTSDDVTIRPNDSGVVLATRITEMCRKSHQRGSGVRLPPRACPLAVAAFRGLSIPSRLRSTNAPATATDRRPRFGSAQTARSVDSGIRHPEGGKRRSGARLLKDSA
jgi:hypothetical protein